MEGRPGRHRPFRLESFTPGQQSVHTRFENYWQSGKPYLDQVTIIDINDANARMNGLISGQVDAIADVPYSQAKLIPTHRWCCSTTRAAAG